jgi:hypothetical protein
MNARYSPIAPVHILRELYNADLLDGYLLLLAHDVLKHPKEYHDLVNDVRMSYCDLEYEPLVIMDNSVIEQGTSVDIADLLEAASIVEADVVVAPDVIGSYIETKKSLMTHGDLIRQSYSLMLVPQGNSVFEVMRCVDWMSGTFESTAIMENATYWGIPRWVANRFESRSSIVHYINLLHKYKPAMAQIHLLGMSQYYRDDVYAACMDNVIGIDSANPLVLGLRGQLISYSPYAAPPHMDRGDYWEQPSLNTTQQCNVERIHDDLGRHPDPES